VTVTSKSPVPWFNTFLGVAYRYFDLRMNVAPLFSNRKEAVNLWHDTIHWWNDHTIKIRFVETGDDYWFIMGADSRRPENNKSFFKILPKSENYERFKKGHGGEAFLRFGVYSKKYKKDVKFDAVCNCGHVSEDHDEGKNKESCYFEDCDCTKFESFQINLLKKKKTITDIQFIQEEDIKDDPLAWNCLYVHKYSLTK